MSISVCTDVHCDECYRWLPGVQGATRSHVRAARQEARWQGWKITKDKDLCPQCAKNEKEPTP